MGKGNVLSKKSALDRPEPPDRQRDPLIHVGFINQAGVGNTVVGNTVVDNTVVDNTVVDNTVAATIPGLFGVNNHPAGVMVHWPIHRLIALSTLDRQTK